MIMNSASEVSVAAQGRESWLPLLQLAATEVFEIMLGTRLEPVTEMSPLPACEITSMVGLAGRLCGVLTLRCGFATATVMTSKMLGVEPQQADPQLWDATGEICNMVAGNFKNKLTGINDKCMLSVPTVISGGDYMFHSLADAGTIEIVMTFENHPIVIALEVHS
jgi:chemotaxis protein CheX